MIKWIKKIIKLITKIIKLLINEIDNNNHEIECNNTFISDNKSKSNIINNDIDEENNSLNENKLDNSKINNNENIYNNNDQIYENIKSTKDLKKLFLIGRATGDGNCLFYSLSTATFGTDAYYNEIRNSICEYMENNDIEDLYDINKKEYINKMRRSGEYGGTTEVQVYSLISKLKIVCFIRTFQEINEYNADDNDPIYCFISGKKNTNEIYIMLNIKNQSEKLI